MGAERPASKRGSRGGSTAARAPESADTIPAGQDDRSGFLLVALPAGMDTGRYPHDLTGHVEEWVDHLDPGAELVDLASTGLGDWATGGHVASPSEQARSLLRDTARREEMALAFRGSDGVLLRPELGGAGDLRLRTAAHGDRLDSRALPVLLGLAVLAVETWPVGRYGVELAARQAASEGASPDASGAA